jgi:hypothetical protein
MLIITAQWLMSSLCRCLDPAAVYVPNEEKLPCRVSSRPAEPQLRVPQGGSEVGQDLEEAFTPLPQAHILFNTARFRIQTAPGPLLRHS